MKVLLVVAQVASQPQTLTLPDGAFTYDAHPWVATLGQCVSTLLICATIVWSLYLLRKPLSEFIERMTEAQTPFGTYKAAVRASEIIERAAGVFPENPDTKTAPTDEADAGVVADVEDRSLLITDSEPEMQLVAIRFNLEQEIWRLCMISAVIAGEARPQFSQMLRLLVVAKLLQPTEADSLRTVYRVSSVGFHRFSRLTPQDEALDFQTSGEKLIERLRSLPHEPKWFEQAIVTRARRRGEVAISREGLRDTSIDLLVGGAQLILKTGPRVTLDVIRLAIDKHPEAVIVLSNEPRQSILVEAPNAAIAWIDQVRFRGTVLARRRAPWLVDLVA